MTSWVVEQSHVLRKSCPSEPTPQESGQKIRQGTTPDLGIGEHEVRGTRIARWCGYRVANMPPEGSDEEDGRTGRESVAC